MGIRAQGGPPEPLLPHPSPGHAPRLSVRTCTCSRRGKDQHEGMCCPGSSGQDGPAGERASGERSGDGSWEGKQRCARQQARQCRASHCSQSHRSGALGRAESQPLLSRAPDFLGLPASLCPQTPSSEAQPSQGKRQTCPLCPQPALWASVCLLLHLPSQVHSLAPSPSRPLLGKASDFNGSIS